jgi:hypothetical protein
VATLEQSLDELSEKDERYRLLANLEPLDEDVKLAGIGGPGSRTLEESRSGRWTGRWRARRSGRRRSWTH